MLSQKKSAKCVAQQIKQLDLSCRQKRADRICAQAANATSSSLEKLPPTPAPQQVRHNPSYCCTKLSSASCSSLVASPLEELLRGHRRVVEVRRQREAVPRPGLGSHHPLVLRRKHVRGAVAVVMRSVTRRRGARGGGGATQHECEGRGGGGRRFYYPTPGGGYRRKGVQAEHSFQASATRDEKLLRPTAGCVA